MASWHIFGSFCIFFPGLVCCAKNIWQSWSQYDNRELQRQRCIKKLAAQEEWWSLKNKKIYHTYFEKYSTEFITIPVSELCLNAAIVVLAPAVNCLTMFWLWFSAKP
jgi:hypothetical protein